MRLLPQWPENNAQTIIFGCGCGVLQTTHTGKIGHFCGRWSVLAVYHMGAWHLIAGAAHWPQKARC